MSGYRQTTGRMGEDVAASHIQTKGYIVLERNYRAERGEIDIIARDGDVIVFIEVKSGCHHGFGKPEMRVDKRKQKQIGKVAMAYLTHRNLYDMDCRFDVIAISREDGRTNVNHIEDAFWLESE